MTRDEIRAKVQELLRDILDDETIVLADDMVARMSSTGTVPIMCA